MMMTHAQHPLIALSIDYDNTPTFFMLENFSYLSQMGKEKSNGREVSPSRSSDDTEISLETHDLPKLQYGIEDVPPFYLWILLGFQVAIQF